MQGSKDDPACDRDCPRASVPNIHIDIDFIHVIKWTPPFCGPNWTVEMD